MAKDERYSAPGDPSDFAPDFRQNPEPYGDPVGELIETLSELRPGATILDVAGGYGKYAVPFANMGHFVDIIDIHQPSLNEARLRNRTRVDGAGRITTTQGDIIRDDPPSKEYDAVFCAGFLHHLDKDGIENLFDTMSKLVRKDGLLVLDFSTDKDRRHPDGSRILVDGVPEQNMSYEMGVEMLKDLYSRHGFVDLRLNKVKLRERQEDFWYDANMIIARGRRG